MSGRFWNPVDVRVGRGSLGELAAMIGGRTVAVVTSEGMQERALWASVRRALPAPPLSVAAVAPNPTFDTIAHTASLTSRDADVILAFGGGSVIDAAKGVVSQRTGGAIIAVPTTAGTGSEVTCWATVWEPGTGRKFSISDPALYPEAAVIDPDVLDSLPFEHSLVPALDALSHACEAIWNRQANPVSDGLAELAIRDLVETLSASFPANYADRDRRARVQIASLRAGLAFSGTRTALAHSISYPLTGLWGMPHGLACSLTLPELLDEAGREDVARVQPVLRACGATDVAGGVRTLSALLRASGADDLVRRYIPSDTRMADLESLLVTPGRAENFIAAATAGDARRVLERALARVDVR